MSATKTFTPATDKQVAFITRLAAERGQDLGDITYLSKTAASGMIDALLATPKPQVAPVATATAGPSVAIEAGKVYANADGDFIKVTASKAGNLYGKVRVDGGWDYRPGLLRGLTLVTAEQAAAWGFEHHACMFCGRNLTDDGPARSVEVGYGPVCAEKYGLPWGVPEAATAALVLDEAPEVEDDEAYAERLLAAAKAS